MEIKVLENLDELLGDLSPDEITDFRLALIDRLEDRGWCEFYGISYINPEPEMKRVKSIVYQELYPDLVH